MTLSPMRDEPCLDCGVSLRADQRYRCADCAEEPQWKNGHAGRCVGCGEDVSVCDWFCSACERESLEDAHADELLDREREA